MTYAVRKTVLVSALILVLLTAMAVYVRMAPPAFAGTGTVTTDDQQWVSQSAPTALNCTTWSSVQGSTSAQKRTVVSFNTAGVVPAGQVVTAATLRVYPKANYSGNNLSVKSYTRGTLGCNLTWNNLGTVGSQVGISSGNFSKNTYKSITLAPSSVNTSGRTAFVLDATAATLMEFRSDAAGTNLNPTKLDLTWATAPTTTTTTTVAPTTTTTPPGGCTGVNVDPATQDLNTVMGSNPAGTTYCLQGGVHRVTTVGGITPETGDVIKGVGANVVVDGAKVLSGWTASGSNFVANGFLPAGPPGPNPCEAGFPGCYWPQDIFLDGAWLTTVTSLADLAPGKAFLDYPNNKVYIRDNPAGHTVEQSWATSIFKGSAQNVQIRNLTYQHAASGLNFGAVDPSGSGWVLDNIEARWNHGFGTGPGQVGYGQTLNLTVTDSNIHHNGQDGSGGDGVGNLYQRNEVHHNSYAGTDRVWDAGNKFGHARNLQVLDSYYHDERGVGIWCDINCENVTIAGNYVKDTSVGIMFEISCGVSIHDNIVVNGSDDRQTAGGSIFISNSRDAEVYNNQVYNGLRGIWAWNILRTEGTETGCPVHEVRNLNVHDNHIDLNDVDPPWAAKVGLWTDQGNGDIYSAAFNNHFEANTYHDLTPGTPNPDWDWGWTAGQYSTVVRFPAWQGYGNDSPVGSVVVDDPAPPAPPTLVVGPQP